MKIVADTSFLMVPGFFNIDVSEELGRVVEEKFELIVPSCVVEELKRISESGSPRERAAARIGLKLVSRAEVLNVRGNADDAILDIAAKNGWAVATNDGELKRKLREKGVTVIFLRGMSRLAVSRGSGAGK
ncbi:MAG: hypothetical protein QXG10_04015 [Candidatus Hadarchaeales archaeon]